MQWGQVLAGVAVGIIISWLPGVSRMLLEALRRRRQRKRMQQIRLSIESNPDIPEDERPKAIALERQRVREETGWTDGLFAVELDPWRVPQEVEDTAIPFGG